jgi:hypothetical protein
MQRRYNFKAASGLFQLVRCRRRARLEAVHSASGGDRRVIKHRKSLSWRAAEMLLVSIFQTICEHGEQCFATNTKHAR